MNTEACNQLGYQESFKNISITSILKKEIYKDGDQLVIDENTGMEQRRLLSIVKIRPVFP